VNNLKELQKLIRSHTDPIRAKNSLWFFKTGKGEYGEGDKFYGLTVPQCRKIAKQFKSLSLTDLDKLIRSKYHEERLIALFILVGKFDMTTRAVEIGITSRPRSYSNTNKEKERVRIYDFYLAHIKWINNWDLVDQSAPRILGRYLLLINDSKIPGQAGNDKIEGGRKILYKLVKSKNLWEKRIAIIATLAFIKLADQYDVTLELAEILLDDKHDLLHKAVGWCLREVGKRDIATLTKFLKLHYKNMPRTTLRYAIEKFPEEIRQGYLSGTI